MLHFSKLIFSKLIPCEIAESGYYCQQSALCQEFRKTIYDIKMCSCFEPHRALFVPDNDPLKFYRAILDLARLYFESRGNCIF